MKKILIATICFFIMGCNVSPFSPKNNNRIHNQGTIEDIKSNQNGIMADIANLRSKLDIMARDLENLQQGLINSNNKNYGIQIFQGEGGIIAGFGIMAILGLLAYNYRLEAKKYKKTAEILGKEIKSLKNKDLENNIYISALGAKVEESVYSVLKNN